ncbi:MAG: bifunctional DNA primase/polymerase [Pyrinomonadaceae bacterium]
MKRRNFICALQGIANGRDEFKCAHLTIARRLGNKAKPESAQMVTYREIKALKKFQEKSGILLFDIEQGGGKEHKTTEYFDRLTGVALRLRDRAAKMKTAQPKLARSPLGKIMESIVDDAVEELPAFDESRIAVTNRASKSRGGGGGWSRRPRAKHPGHATIREEVWRLIDACLDKYDARTEAADRRWLADQMIARINEKVARVQAVQNTKNTEMSDMMKRSPIIITPLQTSPTKTCEVSGGLPNSSPFGELDSGESNDSALPATTPGARFGNSDNPRLAAALDYASRGWRVLPLHAPDERGICSCSKRATCASSGKHPRTQSGVRDATIDESQIKNWWSQWPKANVGIATGSASGIVCLDIDPRNGGNESLQKLLDEFGELPPTFTVATGGGGRHFYFQFPVGAAEKLAGKLGDGVDIKSSGGYIVAPPSTHKSGGVYRVENDSEPAALPGWLLELLTRKNKLPRDPNLSIANKSAFDYQPASTRRGGGFGKIYVEGGRNRKLFDVGCAMRGRGETAEAIEFELLRTNELRCSPPLGADEVLIIASNTLQYERNPN